MRTRHNIKLVVGLVMLLLFVVLAIFGPSFAPYEEDYSKKIKYVQTDEGEQLRAAPFPPSKEHVFGTDKWGYDILTLMLYGAKYTVFASIAVAIIRVIIGGFFGMYHGLQKKEHQWTPRVTVLSGIPPFVIIYFVMIGINIQPSVGTMSLVLFQCMLMIILGIPGVYQVVLAKTIEIRESPFVLASQTVGGNKIHIVKEHIFPTLKGNLLLILVNEVILVLNLIGQLAIFNLFFGGTELQVSPTIYLSITNEWAGLIGQSRLAYYSAKWIIGFPLLGYLLFLFSLYLLANGLKENQREKYQRNVYLQR